MEQLCKWLARTGIKVVKLGERNHVAFDNIKEQMITFSRRRNPNMK